MINKITQIDPLLHAALKYFCGKFGSTPAAVIRDAIYTAVANFKAYGNPGMMHAPTCPPMLEKTTERLRRLKSGQLAAVDQDGILPGDRAPMQLRTYVVYNEKLHAWLGPNDQWVTVLFEALKFRTLKAAQDYPWGEVEFDDVIVLGS